MLGSFIIVFREALEAGLVIGIIMALTNGVQKSRRWISLGLFAGLVGSCAVAYFTGSIASLFGGSGQEYFNAGVLSFAVLMLGWHNVWMARHGREMALEARELGRAISSGEKK